MLCRLEFSDRECSLRYGDKNILERSPAYIVICESISVSQCIEFNTYILSEYGVVIDIETLREEFYKFLLSEPTN